MSTQENSIWLLINNYVFMLAVIWVNLENFVVNIRSQTKMVIYYVNPLV
jgi:hypothetical protein